MDFTRDSRTQHLIEAYLSHLGTKIDLSFLDKLLMFDV